MERTIGDLPLLQPYFFLFFFSFLFFFLLALDLSRFFISLLFFYLLEVCTGRDWRLDILSLTLLFMIVPTGKGTGRNRVIPFVQAHVGSLLCLQYKDLIVHVKQ